MKQNSEMLPTFEKSVALNNFRFKKLEIIYITGIIACLIMFQVSTLKFIFFLGRLFELEVLNSTVHHHELVVKHEKMM